MQQTIDNLIKQLDILNGFFHAHDSFHIHDSEAFEDINSDRGKAKIPCMRIGTIGEIRRDSFFRGNIVTKSWIEYNTGETPELDRYFDGDVNKLFVFLKKFGLKYTEASTDAYSRFSNGYRRTRYISLLDSAEEIEQKLRAERIRIIKLLFEETMPFYIKVKSADGRIEKIVDQMGHIHELHKNRNHGSYFYVTKVDVHYSYSYWYRGDHIEETDYIKYYDLGLKDLTSINQVIGLGFAILEKFLETKQYNFERSLQNGYIYLQATNDSDSICFEYSFPVIKEVKQDPPKQLSDW